MNKLRPWDVVEREQMKCELETRNYTSIRDPVNWLCRHHIRRRFCPARWSNTLFFRRLHRESSFCRRISPRRTRIFATGTSLGESIGVNWLWGREIWGKYNMYVWLVMGVLMISDRIVSSTCPSCLFVEIRFGESCRMYKRNDAVSL